QRSTRLGTSSPRTINGLRASPSPPRSSNRWTSSIFLSLSLTKKRRRNCRPSALPCFLRRTRVSGNTVRAASRHDFSLAVKETGRSLERATHLLPKAGVPLHHRTQESPQSGCHFLAFRAKTQIVASKSIRYYRPGLLARIRIKYRNL